MSLMLVFSLAASYVLGSIPNGLWLGRALWHTDLRQHGSHNTGATNAWRTLGKFPGFLIFFLDMMKGLVSVWLGSVLVGTPIAMILCGIFAIVGHSVSIFMQFRGGKGVATGLGVILMLMLQPTLVVFAVWLAIVAVTRYVSLGSIVAAALVPVLAWLWGYETPYILFGVLAALLIIVRHHANIGRLLNGTESKIRAGHR